MRHRATSLRGFGHGLLCIALTASQLPGQDSLPPWAGGLTASLGQPSRTSYILGGTFGVDWRRDHSTGPVAYALAGITRSLGSPVIGMLAASAEVYGGLRSDHPDGGFRAYLQIPALRTSLGGDYNIESNRFGFTLGFAMAVRRGGIFGGGSLLRAEWESAGSSAVRTSVLVPIRQPAAGHTRPLKVEVDVALRSGPPAPTIPTPAALDSALSRARIAAQRLTRLVLPFIDRRARDPREALAPLIADLRSPPPLPGLAGPGLHAEETVRIYHAAITRALSLAAAQGPLPADGTSPEGERLGETARTVLREHLLYPFDRLLGQWKTGTTFAALAAQARGNFARSVVAQAVLPPEREAMVLQVFDRLVADIQEIERDQQRLWGDSRVVWLPLQLGLRAEDHDTQAELDRIVEAVTGARFTDGNRVWYVVNKQFETEAVRSIAAAEDYHVVWIHDFTGRTDRGTLDDQMPLSMVDAYYRALIRRIREYDHRGRLPVYLILLDQHYYESRRTRLWFDLLEHPLGPIPTMTAADAATIRADQQELARAIQDSRLLQAEARQFGPAWLANLVKVQVNITNPADPSFWSRQVIPLLGIPDNIIRDHRKIVFYDVSEADPYRGLAMYTGMGIGSEYVAPTWEDRALMVQGPALLSLKAQARALLESQGLTGDRMPWVLRERPQAPGYQALVDSEIARRHAAGGRDQRAMELHNGTGFHDKQLSVAKAVLYSLMPPGSVVKVPDSLWGSALFASLLTGSAFRGCRVLFIAPSLSAAPSSNWPAMGVAHELYSRLIVLQEELGLELEHDGGMLKTGIYNPGLQVQDVQTRFATAYRNGRRTPFLRRLFPLSPAVDSLLARLGQRLVARQDSTWHATPAPAMTKLHLKANFFASREGWDSLVARPEMAPLLGTYIEQLLRTNPRDFDVREAANQLAAASDQLEASYRAALSPEDQAHLVYFMMVGSANMDYRSMLLDGEASVLLSGWSGIVGLIDFSLIASLCVWVDDLETLDALLPRPTALQRAIAWQLRYAF